MEKKQKFSYEYWKEYDIERWEMMMKKVREHVKKKYKSPALLDNDIYCESILRSKLRKNGIIY